MLDFPKTTLRRQENLSMHVFLLSWRKAQELFHCQQLRCIMKESTSTNALVENTLNHDGKIVCSSFPYSTRTIAFPKTTLLSKVNLRHVVYHSIVSTLLVNMLHHEVKLALSSFPSITSIYALPKTNIAPLMKSNACYLSFYHEGKLECTSLEK